MLKLKTRLTRFFATIVMAFTLSVMLISPARALSLTEQLLTFIAEFTYGTMVAVNKLPELLSPLSALALAWLDTESDATADLQESFSNQTNYTLDNQMQQIQKQQQFVNDYFNSLAPAYANDLTYTTLLGKTFYPVQYNNTGGTQVPVDAAYNYVKNASGQTLTHPVPSSHWSGSDDKKKKYEEYYKTISAVQTFNSFVMSDLYIDYTGGLKLTQLQSSLMQQASNSEWFQTIATESIGIVLRQLLMFNSQMFVLMGEMLQTQKQTLTAQAMMNTLLILGNQFTETQLIQGATGVIQSSQ